MLANNPHLQKKRNSKKGLGRTLMKRITEIPETMHLHRQCSRDDGSEHGSNRGTLRRNQLEASHQGTFTASNQRQDGGMKTWFSINVVFKLDFSFTSVRKEEPKKIY
uniref:GP158 n=1 Tax=Poeciliopsis prolifica TaxID=188132 RepID=A0A0S7EKX0_9TELE